MHILIAPNAFKHSLEAGQAAAAIARGFAQSRLPCQCECFPVGDGGDGTGGLIMEKCQGQWVKSSVHDALVRKVEASFGLIDNGATAIIEMANASGIRLISKNELNPLLATSYGTGEQMKHALDRGVKKIIIGMGGSATVDGGCGMLKALGIRFLNDSGEDLEELPASLVNLAAIDNSGMDVRIQQCEVVVLCDVDSLLLGKEGAAAVFGPQKGASPEAVNRLDAALGRMAQVALQQFGKDMATIPYGGTAGGAAAGLFALLNARLVNGIDYFLDLTGFDQSLQNASLVITGEGSIDEQTLQGKGPFGVARRAKQQGVPVIGLAGNVPLEPSDALHAVFDVLLAIGNQPCDLPRALAATNSNLERTAKELGNMLHLHRK